MTLATSPIREPSGEFDDELANCGRSLATVDVHNLIEKVEAAALDPDPIAGNSKASHQGREPTGLPPLTHVGRALAKLLSEGDILKALRRDKEGKKLLGDLRGVVRVNQLAEAIEELAGYLASGENEESIYQDWCERHSWVFGNA
jgi:hypothetical protein